MRACGTCGTTGLPDAARFCLECGSPLATGCGSCGEVLPPAARFCLACGAAQGGAPAATPAAAPTPPAAGASPNGQQQGVAARRVTSVLFGDLVSFTSLSESRDQEEVRELLSSYFEECSRIITRYGGTVEKFIGDAVMAVWGVPVAQEDDAERAVRAGMELVGRIETLGADLGLAGLQMRVGVVTGEVAVTLGATGQGMVAGDAVNTASRVQSAASPGQVWVDETTRMLTTSAISYLDTGAHELKGKAEPVPLWAARAVVAAIGGAQRADGLEAPLVGRERELRLVKELFHSAEETRRPALVVIAGEAGTGKTRLAWELDKYCDGLRTVTKWHAGRCLAYGEAVAYHALADAVRGRLRLLQPEQDGDDTAVGDTVLLELGLERFVADPAERDWLRPRVGALIGVVPAGSFPREDLFAAWTAFLARVGEDRDPVLLVIDDAEHADDGLLDFLEYLLAVAEFGCFVVLLARPTLLADNPGIAANRRATVLHLEQLAPQHMAALVDGLVADLPVPVRDALVQRAEGIPLYAVETVRSLIDRDLVLPREGHYVLADPDLDLETVGAPASLQALVQARLDTLAPTHRRVLDLASVLGASFPAAHLATLCPEVADLDDVLASLVRLQLLRRQSNRFSAEAGQLQFVQDVVRQVAYSSLSRRDRKQAHLTTADLLARDDADERGDVAQAEDAGAATDTSRTSAERAAVIAEHLLQALEAVPDAPDSAALADRAVGLLRAAATRAAALGAPAEAAAHLTTALERSGSRARPLVELDLADYLGRAGLLEQARAHAAHARDVFDADGLVLHAATAVVVFLRYLSSSDPEHVWREAVAEAQQRLTAVADIEGSHQVRFGLVRFTVIAAQALYPGSAQHLEGVVLASRLADVIGDPVGIARAQMSLATYFQVTGLWSAGTALQEHAAAIARTHRDHALRANVLINLTAGMTAEDAARSVALGEESLDAARASGNVYERELALSNLMLAELARGEWDALERQLVDLADLSDTMLTPFVAHSLARARSERSDRSGPGWSEDVSDPWEHAFSRLVLALRAEEDHSPDAGSLGLEAVRLAFDSQSFYDDFTVVFGTASDIALATGDLASARAMLDLVETHGLDVRLPIGLRAMRSRLRGLLARVDEDDPALVESHLREAIDHATAWSSAPILARCQGDLGGWLVRQGRSAEAEPLLAAARETFTSLRATRWLDDLERAVAKQDA